MTIDRLVFIIAGSMVLLSVFLTHYVDANWFWLTVFVGFNMLQSGLTKFCPLVNILKALGFKHAPAAA